MKRKITIATLWLFSVATVSVAGSDTPEAHFIERKKTIIKAFDVKPNDALSIDNRYGDVKVQLWDKQSIRVEITITANAPTEERASETLNSVKIEEKRGSGGISIQTVIASGNTNWGNRKGENSLRIDYHIQMPKQNPLQLKNSFGDTDIAHFLAPLTVESKYGSFRAQDLASMANNIVILYGNAAIGHMGTGKLESKYSKVNLEKVKSLELINKFGSLDIGEVGSLKADIDYSGAKIGTITENGSVKLSYSNGFSINSSTADNLDIQAAYSSVVIPAQKPAKIDVSVTYGNFQYPQKAAISVTNVSGSSKTKQYEGSIGTDNPASTIKVVSKYGNVKLKD